MEICFGVVWIEEQRVTPGTFGSNEVAAAQRFPEKVIGRDEDGQIGGRGVRRTCEQLAAERRDSRVVVEGECDAGSHQREVGTLRLLRQCPFNAGDGKLGTALGEGGLRLAPDLVGGRRIRRHRATAGDGRKGAVTILVAPAASAGTRGVARLRRNDRAGRWVSDRVVHAVPMQSATIVRSRACSAPCRIAARCFGSPRYAHERLPALRGRARGAARELHSRKS